MNIDKLITSFSLSLLCLTLGCGRQPQWTEIPDDPVWPGAPSEYAIGVVTAPTPFAIGPALEAQPEPVLTGSDVDGLATAYVADPFLFHHADGRWYLFYELLKAFPRRGQIAWAESDDDGRTWAHKGLAIEEPFHMSFPYIFEWEGEVYMVLESNEIGEIRLYRSTDFPGGWTLESVLVEGVFVDNAIVRHDDHWWLFASSLNSRELHLFHSEHLTHGWTPHAQSPVIENDIHRARPAGRIISYDDRLWRFAMDCGPRYGYAVRLMEILTLTKTEYEEREDENSPLIKAGMAPWAGLGMHHYDPWPYRSGDEAWLITIDGNTPVQPETPLEVQFGDGSLLLGATQRPRNIPAGEPILLRLYWKSLPQQRAHVFIHFMQDDEVVFQGDHTLDERPEQYDLYIPVPENVPPGEVTVHIGLHIPGRGRIAAQSPYPITRNAVELPIRFTVAAPPTRLTSEVIHARVIP